MGKNISLCYGLRKYNVIAYVVNVGGLDMLKTIVLWTMLLRK